MFKKVSLLSAFVVLTLVSCGGEGTSILPSSSTTPTTSSSTVTSNPTSTTALPAPVTLSYAGWNLGSVTTNNIERQMLAAYQELNPHISLNIIERPAIVDEETGVESVVNWPEFFATQAAIDNLPDVYMTADLSSFTSQGWAEEVTSLVNSDPDFTQIPQDIRVSAAFNDRYFALPQSIFYFGFFINRTAINRVGPRAVLPTYGMTYAQLMDAASKNSKAPVEGGDAIIGISGLNSLINWLPAQLNPELGWFTYNDVTGYELDGPEFAQAMTEQQKYFGAGKTAYQSYVLESLEPSQYANYFGVAENIFESGNQSIRFEGSYAMRDWHTRSLNPNDLLYGADIDFIGTPSWVLEGGQKVNRIPLVVDYLALGKGTKHKEEAYKLAKWMGYSAEGYAKRLELAKTNPQQAALNFTPLIPRQDLIDGFFELYPQMTEFKKIVEQHDSFILESLGKNVPGYWNSRQNAFFDVVIVKDSQGNDSELNRTIGQAIEDIVFGRLTLADALQKGLNTIAVLQWTTAKQALDTYLNS